VGQRLAMALQDRAVRQDSVNRLGIGRVLLFAMECYYYNHASSGHQSIKDLAYLAQVGPKPVSRPYRNTRPSLRDVGARKNV
jgi:hypothetical protein